MQHPLLRALLSSSAIYFNFRFFKRRFLLGSLKESEYQDCLNILKRTNNLSGNRSEHVITPPSEDKPVSDGLEQPVIDSSVNSQTSLAASPADSPVANGSSVSRITSRKK